MARRLADLALRRPWVALGANLVFLAAALAIAVGAPAHLGIGSLRLSGAAPGAADIQVVTHGPVPVRAREYRVALDVISSELRSDPSVDRVNRGPVAEDRKTTSLDVTLEPADEADRFGTLRDIEDGVDPGPLDVTYGGELAALDDARADLSGDLWKLELLALPLVLLVLVAALGWRLALAPIVCAATAIAGSLALLRLASLIADVSLVGEAPAAVVGLALGVELPSVLVARYRREATLPSPDEAIRLTVLKAGPAVVVGGAAAAVAPLGLLATGLDQAGSVVFATAAAAILATASALAASPSLLSLFGGRLPTGRTAGGYALRPVRALRGALAWLAERRWRTVALSLLALAALLALAWPALDGMSAPFSVSDLPPGSPALIAAERLGAVPVAVPGVGLFSDLPLAAAASALAITLLALGAFRSIRAIPFGLAGLLPAGAAAGLSVFIIQDGHLASAIGQERQGALETGALACLVAALAGICAQRCCVALALSRAERTAVAPAGTAQNLARLTLPAALSGTLVAGAAAGVLAGTDLYSAREFGLAVAAGLVTDLVLVRPPFLAALGRWFRRH